jgi:prepilin-type N-terminal cleavage/methylation domain-containing protein
MTSHARRRWAGFTLLEVLVGFVIIALAATIALQSSSLAIDATGKSGDAARAALHGRSLLTGIGTTAPLREGEISGRLEDASEWTLTVTAAPSTTPLLRAFDIHLAVTTGRSRVVLESRRITPNREQP